MSIDLMIKLILSPEFQGIIATITSMQIVADVTSKIRIIRKQKREDSHEWQLINCLEQALYNTQDHLGWEKDPGAFADNFVGNLISFSQPLSADALEGIFIQAVRHEITKDDINVWITQFYRQISLPKHTALRELLKIELWASDRRKKEKFSVGRIITPKAPQWVNGEIVCRDALIESLCDELLINDAHMQLIGMGGIGKTEILNRIYSNYACSVNPAFEHIGLFFYSGNIEEDLEEQLDYPRKYKGLKGKAAARQFLCDLCEEKKVLLLFDDCRQKKDMISQQDSLINLFKSLHSNMMVASRVPIPYLRVLPVYTLKTDDCVEVFIRNYRKIVNEDELCVLKEIIEQKAGNNTLIVKRLGSMALDYDWTIYELYNHLKNKGFCIANGQIQQEIQTLYPMSENFDSAPKSILEAFATFPATPFPKDICIKWMCADANIDADECNLLLVQLERLTWIVRCQTKEEKVYYFMPQVVVDSVRSQTRIELSSHQNLAKECADMIRCYTSRCKFDEVSQLMPFAISIYKCMFCEELSIAKLASVIGEYYDLVASHSKSLEWYYDSYSICERVLGEEHPETAMTKYLIGWITNKKGDYPQSLKILNEALIIQKKVLGEKHEDTARTYNDIGVVYVTKGEYPSALEFLKAALNIREEVLGKDHVSTAETLANIALMYQLQDSTMESLEVYYELLIIQEKKWGKNHPYTAKTYHNIACVHSQKRDYNEAIKMFRRALTIKEDVWGKGHPETAVTYLGVAKVYCDQGDINKAMEIFFVVLEIFITHFGEDHPYTATTYYNIATSCVRLGKYDKALNFYQRAYFIRESLLGQEHLDTLTTCKNIGMIYINQNDYSNALEWHYKLLDAQNRYYGEAHKDTMMTCFIIAELHIHQSENSKALEIINNALIILEDVWGKDNINVVMAYRSKAKILKNQGDYREALELFFRASEILEKDLGKDHVDTTTNYHNVAETYELLGNYSMAYEWHEKGLRSSKDYL